MEWNGMEWNGMEWNGMEWKGTQRKEIKYLLLLKFLIFLRKIFRCYST